MKLKLFTKNECPNCPPAKTLAEEIESEEQLEVEYFNVDEAEGLGEAQFYNILATPSLVLCDKQDNEVKSWRGEVPEKQAIYDNLE
ncbi:MAG: thioredoxin family protein [Candidatus Moranbacteria bacterium]|nr:thioredoxin family protein [Candidatus Moranbacteria bacterium]